MFLKRRYSHADPSLSRSKALLSAYKVLFFERIIGVTPAARAFAHVQYLTASTTLGFAVGAGVGVCVGATSVMGLIPAVTA